MKGGWPIPPPCPPVKRGEDLRQEREATVAELARRGLLRSERVRGAMLTGSLVVVLTPRRSIGDVRSPGVYDDRDAPTLGHALRVTSSGNGSTAASDPLTGSSSCWSHRREGSPATEAYPAGCRSTRSASFRIISIEQVPKVGVRAGRSRRWLRWLGC